MVFQSAYVTLEITTIYRCQRKLEVGTPWLKPLKTCIFMWRYLPCSSRSYRCWSHHRSSWIHCKGLISGWADVDRNWAFFSSSQIWTCWPPLSSKSQCQDANSLFRVQVRQLSRGSGWPSGLRRQYLPCKNWPGAGSNLSRPKKKKALIPSHSRLTRDRAIALYSGVALMRPTSEVTTWAGLVTPQKNASKSFIIILIYIQ